MTDSNLPESQLLTQLTEEFRDEADAQIDFDALENRIVARAELEQSRTRRRTWFAGGLSLAAAAAVALFMSRSRTAPDPMATAAVPTQGRTLSGAELNGNGLSETDRIVATDSPVHVVHAKHSEWTLSPGSEARTLSVGERVVVALSSGTLAAKVVPNEKPETFVVEAKDTRVAVHGTDFSVILKNDAIAVQVREGIVAVGPRGEKPRWFLNGGDKGSFAFSGQTGSVERDPTAALVKPAEAVPETGTHVPQLRHVPPAESASAAELQALSNRAATVATQCFGQHVNLEAGVRITAKSQMTVTVAPNGRLGAVTFDPPLAPQVQTCVQSRLGTPKLTASRNGGTTQQTVWLSP